MQSVGADAALFRSVAYAERPFYRIETESTQGNFCLGYRQRVLRCR